MSPEFDLIAKFGGLCPVCCKLIAKSRSRVAALPCDFPPNPRHCFFSNGRFYADNFETNTKRRRWAHADCLRRLDARMPAIADQLMLAEDWAVELAEVIARDAELTR